MPFMAAPTVPFDPALVSYIRRILSVAETDRAEWNPSAVYIYADDNRYQPPRKQITLSIGFTEGGGNLKKVLKGYVDKGGKLGAQLAPYLPSLGSGPTLAGDTKFINLLKEAGKDPVMVQAQQECFDEFYLGPAFVWARSNGFTLPLSYMVIADSYLHSGSMLPRLMNSFPEKKPKDGGNEQAWIRAYTEARKQWLATHRNQVLNKTVYRANCYLEQMERGNWGLGTYPIVMNGTSVAPIV
jgi:chitosanase